LTHSDQVLRVKPELEALASIREMSCSTKICVLLTIASQDWPAGFAQFASRVKQLDLRDMVLVVGKIPQSAIGHLYRRCDALLFTSLCEAFGWPMIEAGHFGLPILAADVPLNREMAGRGAEYFPPNEPEKLAKAIVHFVEDRDLRRRLVIEGEAHFTRSVVRWPSYVDRLISVTGAAVRRAQHKE
jgi:glycosyltransferase involved in cell wall biosynthesis